MDTDKNIISIRKSLEVKTPEMIIDKTIKTDIFKLNNFSFEKTFSMFLFMRAAQAKNLKTERNKQKMRKNPKLSKLEKKQIKRTNNITEKVSIIKIGFNIPVEKRKEKMKLDSIKNIEDVDTINKIEELYLENSILAFKKIKKFSR